MADDTLCTAYREKAIYLRHIPLTNSLPTSLYLLSKDLTKTVCLPISLPTCTLDPGPPNAMCYMGHI